MQRGSTESFSGGPFAQVVKQQAGQSRNLWRGISTRWRRSPGAQFVEYFPHSTLLRGFLPLLRELVAPGSCLDGLAGEAESVSPFGHRDQGCRNKRNGSGG